MINNKIIEIRQKNKLSQAEFAKILNVSKDNVGRIERGQHKNIDLNLLLSLAENFDINIHWLITGQDPEPDQTEVIELRTEIRILREMLQLPSIKKKKHNIR